MDLERSHDPKLPQKEPEKKKKKTTAHNIEISFAENKPTLRSNFVNLGRNVLKKKVVTQNN